jgi:hypothetical protein
MEADAMNTVLLAECAQRPETPHWWNSALRSVAGVEPRHTRSHIPLPLPPGDDAGAQRVAARLKAILDDNWTLICGYCSSAGRLEHILVGPRGVMTLASTSLHGRIHCDGERWRRDKFDLYNNLVERDAPVATDPGGALYAASARLQQVLLGQTSIRQVALALVFTHHAATLGTIRHRQLGLVTLLSDLKSATLLQALSGHPDHRTIDGVVDVIRHEHARFVRQNSPRRRGSMARLLDR